LAISIQSVIRSVAYAGGCCRPPLAGSAFACRRSRAVSAREYGKDQARHRGGFAHPSTEQVNYSKMPLQIARVGFGISGAPRRRTASHRSSRTASRTRASTLGAVPIAYFSATAERSASPQENRYRLYREVAHGHLLLLELARVRLEADFAFSNASAKAIGLTSGKFSRSRIQRSLPSVRQACTNVPSVAPLPSSR